MANNNEVILIIDTITVRIKCWNRLVRMFPTDEGKKKWEAKIEELENLRAIIVNDFL
ncbi:hypothetical protein L8C07_06090 [Paenibacillus sp. CMAA1739]|uniref:hypothetical protein n=1 Tax=Paenibacillus ottowii TaxID=2315729 RepID=UPI002DBC8413|nr:hypothetical protein [Paenibacillus sp. CMAA1739]MEC4565510.1 hypothetical protein [Paenibacillus sp. CMAA1739]